MSDRRKAINFLIEALDAQRTSSERLDLGISWGCLGSKHSKQYPGDKVSDDAMLIQKRIEMCIADLAQLVADLSKGEN